MNPKQIARITDDALDTVSEGSSKAAEGARSAASSVWSNAVTLAHHISELVVAVRSTGVGDILGMVGLRRRSVVPQLTSFAAGVTLGAVVGALFAPKAGSETRAILARAAGELVGATGEKIHATTAKLANAAKVFSGHHSGVSHPS